MGLLECGNPSPRMQSCSRDKLSPRNSWSVNNNNNNNNNNSSSIILLSFLPPQQSPASPGSPGSEDSSAAPRRTEEVVAFCGRFQLPQDELPLPSWQTGKRCSVMDRDRPLTLTRSGRLYLTHRYAITVDSLESGHPWDQSKCPDWRGGLISEVDLYYTVNPATLGTSQSVLIRGVASFQGSRLEGVHCTQ